MFKHKLDQVLMCIVFSRSKVDKLDPDIKFRDIITAGHDPQFLPASQPPALCVWSLSLQSKPLVGVEQHTSSKGQGAERMTTKH
jgi:hypothetical protein